MNNERIEQLILLQQSGELSAAEQQELEQALQQPEAQETAAAYQWLMDSARKATELPPENDLVTQRILLAAPAPTTRQRYWPPALAIAATLAVMLTGAVLLLNPPGGQIEIAEIPAEAPALEKAPPETVVAASEVEAAVDEFAELFASASDSIIVFDTEEAWLDQFSERLLAYNE